VVAATAATPATVAGASAAVLRSVGCAEGRAFITQDSAVPVSATLASITEHLIDVGLELMHRNGYNATGLTEILKAADVPKGSFYHHFGSKEDFAAAALGKYVAHEGEHTATVLSDLNTPPLKRLKRYFRDLVKTYGQEGKIPGCMIGRPSLEMAAESSELRKRIGASFASWERKIAVVVQQAVEQKKLPADTDPESLAGFLLNSWEGALLRSQAEKSDAPLETFMRFVFDGLLTKKSKVKAGATPATTRGTPSYRHVAERTRGCNFIHFTAAPLGGFS
jgi:TetR/AcrR family transcriptional repressor of nem operon